MIFAKRGASFFCEAYMEKLSFINLFICSLNYKLIEDFFEKHLTFSLSYVDYLYSTSSGKELS